MKEVWNQKLAAAVLTAVLAGSTSVVWAAIAFIFGCERKKD